MQGWEMRETRSEMMSPPLYRCAVEGAPGDEVAERRRRGRPRRACRGLGPVLTVDDAPGLVEVALLRRQADLVLALAHRALVVPDHREPRALGEHALCARVRVRGEGVGGVVLLDWCQRLSAPDHMVPAPFHYVLLRASAIHIPIPHPPNPPPPKYLETLACTRRRGSRCRWPCCRRGHPCAPRHRSSPSYSQPGGCPCCSRGRSPCRRLGVQHTIGTAPV